MTVPEKTRYGVGRGLVLLGVNHYEYVLFGSILKVCEAFERFPVFNGVFDRGTFFGGCHDQKNYVTPDFWRQSKNTSYFLVSKLEKLNLRNCLLWWENIEKFTHQKKKKKIFVSLSLSKDKIFVNISSCWLCSKQISEKIKWHQLISKSYVIKTSSAYQDGMIV